MMLSLLQGIWAELLAPVQIVAAWASLPQRNAQSLFCLFAGCTVAVTNISQHRGLAPKTFDNLPLGAVVPSGWLRGQMDVQMSGLAGHMHEFYHFVNDTDWTGGPGYYSVLEEAGSYWFNGAVPSAVLTRDENIYNLTLKFLYYVLDHQDEAGWLGPEVGTNKPRYLWGRYPFFFGAIQLMEYNPALIPRVIPALHRFVVLANKMLHKHKANGEDDPNETGVDDWAATRWEDFVIALQWLHDWYPEGQEALLVDTMKMLKYTGVAWEDVFAQENFPKVAVEGLPEEPFRSTWHGVNIAEGAKALPATYRFTWNSSDLERASEGWDLLFKYHGRPSGAFAADEHLAGLDAHRGTELCLVVEIMFSGSYLFQVTGDIKYADQVERIAYNALPAELTADMWGRQYLQQQNQVSARNMTDNPFASDGPYANVFGLEPDYPCCTVNFHQGWPKFIANAFVVSDDRTTLVQAFLGPFSVNTVLVGGNHVVANSYTTYPFSDLISIEVTADAPFVFALRIPSWVTGGSYSLNGEADQSIKPIPGLFYIGMKKGYNMLRWSLAAPITIEHRPNGAVAIHRGPLHYAFDIPLSSKIIARHPAEPRAVDYQLDAAEPWQYAIDPSTLRFHDSRTPLETPVWGTDGSPVTISVEACEIEWDLGGETYAGPPPQEPTCVGKRKRITLVPYGSTRLRISEFPVIRGSIIPNSI